MLSLLVTILIALLIVALIMYAIDLLGIDGRIAQFAKLVVIILAVVVIVQRAGWMG